MASRKALRALGARLLAAPPAPFFPPRGFAASAAPAASPQPQPESPAARAPRRWEPSRPPKPEVALPAEAVGPLTPRPWGEKSKRTGVLGIKCGMTAEWTAWGERLPLTVIWLDDCQARPTHSDPRPEP